MIARLIQLCIRWRGLTVLAAVGILLGGIAVIRTMPIDAIPDLSDVQVIVFTEYPGQAPQVVEDQITYPLVTALLAVTSGYVILVTDGLTPGDTVVASATFLFDSESSLAAAMQGIMLNMGMGLDMGGMDMGEGEMEGQQMEGGRDPVDTTVRDTLREGGSER